MCGFAGLYDSHAPPAPEMLDRMAASLVKRGPDDVGCVCRGDVGLIHRRLSIIDLAGGQQPILSEDGDLALVANGEIYDFAELREELEARGHTFRTRSDSEVLLHLYEDMGPDMVRRLNGMFAFAIVNLDRGDIFMARDRLGQKPLFMAVGEGRLAFASGPAALAAVPWVDTALNPAAVNDYLTGQCIAAPQTIYRGIRKLQPGTMAFWHQHTLSIESYWKPEMNGLFPGTYREGCEALRDRLRAAVRRRLVADVPLGMFLSGGIDSSIICALAQEHLGGTAKTFSIGFPDSRYDERRYAAAVAEHLGTDHHFREVVPGDFAQLERIVGDFEEPFADSSMLPTQLLSEFTRQHVTVALSGDGADELFGGYYRYRVMRLYEYLSVCPKSLRRAVSRALLGLLPAGVDERTCRGKLRRLGTALALDGMDRYRDIIGHFPTDLKERVYGPVLADELEGSSTINVARDPATDLHGEALVNKIMEGDLRTYLSDDILVKVDRASMAHALEVRSPFLDPQVVELALALPYSWKQRGAVRKRILVDTFGGLLPGGVARRRKMGFGVPVAAWLRDAWREPARELLLDGPLAETGLCRRQGLADLLQAHLDGVADHSYPIFALMVLALWLDRDA